MLTRDGTAEPLSRDQIHRREIFPFAFAPENLVSQDRESAVASRDLGTHLFRRLMKSNCRTERGQQFDLNRPDSYQNLY